MVYCRKLVGACGLEPQLEASETPVLPIRRHANRNWLPRYDSNVDDEFQRLANCRLFDKAEDGPEPGSRTRDSPLFRREHYRYANRGWRRMVESNGLSPSRTSHGFQDRCPPLGAILQTGRATPTVFVMLDASVSLCLCVHEHPAGQAR